MGLLKKVSIGFVLSEGFRAADVVSTQAVLGLYPLNKCFYIAAQKGWVYGKSGFPIMADTSFDDCPDLDVLVVGEQLDTTMDQNDFLKFIAQQSKRAKYVIGVSNGVLALAAASVLKGYRVGSGSKTLEQLKAYGLMTIEKDGVVQDGKFYTAGPSTGGIEAAFAVLKELRGNMIAKFVELTLEYNPEQQFAATAPIHKADLPEVEPLKIGVFTPPGMYVPDIMGAVDVLGSLPNAELYYISKEKGAAYGLLGPSLCANTTLEDCPQLDVIIIGATLPKYAEDREVLDFFIRQEQQARAIISVCAGTLVVGAAGLLKGRTASTNYQQVSLLSTVDCIAAQSEVSVDGKFYSAGPAVGSYEVGLKVVKEIVGQAWAQHIEESVLEFKPKPLYGVGSPELASKSMVRFSLWLTSLVNPIFRAAAKRGYRSSLRKVS